MSDVRGWRSGVRTRKKCFNCSEPGHFSAQCPKPKRTDGGGYAAAAAHAIAGEEDEDAKEERERREEEVRIQSATEKQVKAYWKKLNFKRGMDMNLARTERGMKQKNYLLLAHKTGGDVSLDMVVEMLL